MTKLYTFGCSFTRYMWPTWADILAQQFNYHENWGQAGAGNFFIYNSVIECILKNKLTSDDLVIIMWTSTAREDRYVDGKWVTPGGLYFENDQINYKNYLIRDLSLIYGVEQILKQHKIPYIFLSMIPLELDHEINPDTISDIDELFDLYKETINTIRPSIYEVVFNCDWFSRPKRKLVESSIITDIKRKASIFQLVKELVDQYGYVDIHPLPVDYVEYLEKVLPEFTIHKEVKDWALSISDDIRQNKNIKWSQKNIKRI